MAIKILTMTYEVHHDQLTMMIEQIELPAKILDCFLWSNKSNINPSTL